MLSPALHFIAVVLACVVADITGIREANLASFDCRAGELRLVAPVAAGDRVLIAADLRPIGWATLASGSGAGDYVVRLQGGRLCGASRDALSAWVVPADALASLAAAWPPDAAPHAVVETIAPGGRAAWLRMPPGWDIATGERLWRRAAGGQPLIRLDARFAEGPLIYCDVVPLAQDARIHEGDRVARWRDRGQLGAASAVCFIEERDGGPLIWIAAPHGVACPDEPRVEIRCSRDGCGPAIADGIVERRGGRFWYVRLDGAAEASALRIGDDVVVRTDAMLAAGRFAARIFESRPEGHLITAGELDGLRAGQAGVAWRDEAPLADIHITRLQRAYSVIRPAGDASGGEAVELRVGDEVRFSPPPPLPRVVGRIVAVVDGSLLAVQSDTVQRASVPASQPGSVERASVPVRETPLLTPLALHDEAGLAAVAILLAERDGVALGFAIDESIARPLAPGMGLEAPAAEAAP